MFLWLLKIYMCKVVREVYEQTQRRGIKFIDQIRESRL